MGGYAGKIQGRMSHTAAAKQDCLTDDEVDRVVEIAPGDVPRDVALHLTQCSRCQERVLFGSEPRPRRRREATVLPTPARALVLLGILLLVVLAFFFTLERLVGQPAQPPPPEGPSTGSSAPLSGADSSESAKAITRAMDPGDVHVDRSAPGMASRLAGVSMMPGRTALNRTPRARFSAARTRVRAWRPDLATA